MSAGAGVPLCVAAVITGGTFDDATYLRYAAPSNFAAAGIAAVLYLVAGLGGFF